MKNVPLLLITIFCAACVHPYFGYTEAEWNRLPEKQQQAIKAEYQPIIDAKRAQRHEDLIDERTQQVIDLGAHGLGHQGIQPPGP